MKIDMMLLLCISSCFERVFIQLFADWQNNSRKDHNQNSIDHFSSIGVLLQQYLNHAFVCILNVIKVD